MFFCSSGSEGVETAIKFSRAHTGRDGLLYADGAFHGLTCGALSLMSDPFWSDGFGPMLPGTRGGSLRRSRALERQLATRKFAAFIVEPVQAEAGIRVPDAAITCNAAQALCRRYGTLFVLDEVQTGMYRTGGFLAAHRFGRRARHGDSRESALRRPDSGGRGADVRGDLRFGLQLAASAPSCTPPPSARTASRCARDSPRSTCWKAKRSASAAARSARACAQRL